MADKGTQPMPSPSPLVSPTPAPVQPASQAEMVHATNLSTCVLVILVMSWSIGGHHLTRRMRYLTEGSAACALGLTTGLILLVFHHYLSWEIVTQLLEFNAAGFFTYLLPPVIFYCGLSVEKSRFFVALPSILMFGVFGTIMSFALISIFLYVALGFALFKLEDCLAMGAIFAATDSVATLQVLDRTTQPALFSLVFGEGVVNDAVSVVLLGAVANTAKANAAAAAGAMAEPRHGSWAGGVVANFVWLLVTSWALGSAAGFGITATLKKLHLSGAHQELAVITLLSYLSYLLADVLGLSGILSLFVCGVIVSHYAFHNVSEEGRNVTMVAFKTASYLAEGIIFIYVGMDALDPLKWKGANAAEVVWLMLLLTALLAAARAAFVIPFSIIHNIWSHEKLRTREIVVVWWAGLMRGAVSVALVYYYFDDNPREMPDRARATLIVSTLMVVMLSILGFGAFTKPLLAAMLKGDRDMPLMDQLRAIPLLSNFTRETSSASLLIERVDNTFRQQHQQPLFGVSAANTPRQQSSNGSTGRSGDSAPGSGGYYRGMLGMQQDGGSTREMTKDGSSGADATAAVAQAPAAVLPIAPVAAAGSTGGFIGFDIDDAAIAAAGAGEPLIPGDEFSALPHGQQ